MHTHILRDIRVTKTPRQTSMQKLEHPKEQSTSVHARSVPDAAQVIQVDKVWLGCVVFWGFFWQRSHHASLTYYYIAADRV